MEKLIFKPENYIHADTIKTLVLIDWSNLMYRAWFSSKEQPWLAYLRFFDMVRACVHKSKQAGVPLEVIFCGESRTPLKRLEVDPTYKSNRSIPKNDEFREYRQELCRILEILGWKIISIPGAEADDVIASIVNQVCHRCQCKVKCVNCDCQQKYKTDVVIFSGDRDLQQLLAWDRVLIWRHPGIFVTKESFEDEYSIPIALYTAYKALVGDKSDNIPGVHGVGPAWAFKALSTDALGLECDLLELGDHAIEEFNKAYQLVKLETELNIEVPKFKIPNDLSDILNADIILAIKRLLIEF